MRRLQVQKLIEKDADDTSFLEITKLYVINEMDADGNNKHLYRQFLQAPIGSITEIFTECKIGKATGAYDHLRIYDPEAEALALQNKGDKDKDNIIPVVYSSKEAKKRVARGVFAGFERA